VKIGGETEEAFKQAFARIGKTEGPGGLTLRSCVDWIDRANAAKAWIPYGGDHQMQAGVGIEVAIVDAGGKTVAKIRHSDRQGMSQSEAAAEVVDEIVNFVREH
jgi:hypothetical protein